MTLPRPDRPTRIHRRGSNRRLRRRHPSRLSRRPRRRRTVPILRNRPKIKRRVRTTPRPIRERLRGSRPRTPIGRPTRRNRPRPSPGPKARPNLWPLLLRPTMLRRTLLRPPVLRSALRPTLLRPAVLGSALRPALLRPATLGKGPTLLRRTLLLMLRRKPTEPLLLLSRSRILPRRNTRPLLPRRNTGTLRPTRALRSTGNLSPTPSPRLLPRPKTTLPSRRNRPRPAPVPIPGLLRLLRLLRRPPTPGPLLRPPSRRNRRRPGRPPRVDRHGRSRPTPVNRRLPLLLPVRPIPRGVVLGVPRLALRPPVPLRIFCRNPAETLRRAAFRHRAHRRGPGRLPAGRLVDRGVHGLPAPGVAGIALTGQRLPFPGDLVHPRRLVVPAFSARAGAPTVHRAIRPGDWQRSVTANSRVSKNAAVAGRGPG